MSEINNVSEVNPEQEEQNEEEKQPVGFSWWNPLPEEQYYEHPLGNSN